MRLAICDDEAPILEGFTKIIKEKYPGFDVTSHLTPFSLEAYVFDEKNGMVDMIIMDIQLGEENGIELAKRIQKEYPQIMIIFLTGYLEYARDIFKADPSYFLVKPVTKEELFAAIDRCLALLPGKKKSDLLIQNKGTVLRLETNKILYIESNKRTIDIVSEDGRETFYGKLQDMEARLAGDFIRCHQSYLVNMNHIKKIEPEQILLTDETKIPVSRSKYRQVKAAFMGFLMES